MYVSTYVRLCVGSFDWSGCDYIHTLLICSWIMRTTSETLKLK